MQTWWKSLTFKQKIALIVAILGAIGGISAAFNINLNTGDTTTQNTHGNFSPAISGTQGDVNMNITAQDAAEHP